MAPDLRSLVGFNQLNRDRWVAEAARSLPEGTRVLDVGAGQARYRALFSHCEYLTQDFCQYEGTRDGLLKEEWNYRAIDIVSDIIAIPVESERFDVILCTEVLEHVPEPIAALREMSRILKVGGRLFLTAPLGCGLHQEPHHYYGGFTPHFYRKFLPEFGMEVESVEPNGGLFRMLVQENNRAGHLLTQLYRYPRWHPMSWVIRCWMHKFCPIVLSRADDEHLIEEFTVGYHVRAKKVR